MADLNRVVGIRLAAGENGIPNEQVFWNHAGAVSLDIAGLAAELSLQDVTNHFQVLAHTPCTHRAIELAAGPIWRIFAGQMTSELEGGAFGFAELCAGKQAALAVMLARRKELSLSRLGFP